MKTLLCNLAAIAFLSQAYVVGDEPAVKDLDARSAIADFKKQRSNLDEALEKVIADYQAKYREKLIEYQRTLIAKLAERMDAATKAAKLDEALTIREALKYYQRKELLDANQPRASSTETAESNAVRKKVAELEEEIDRLTHELESAPDKIPVPGAPQGVVGTWAFGRGLVYVFKPDGTLAQVTADGKPIENWTGTFRLLDGKIFLLWGNGKYHICEFRNPNTLAHPPHGDLKRVIGAGR